MMIKATRYSPMLGTYTSAVKSTKLDCCIPASLGFFEKVPYHGMELANIIVDPSGNGKVDESRKYFE